MANCAVPEMRDVLPELAAERLAGAALAEASAHVAGCAACAAELELLRLARRAVGRGVPTVDVDRVVAALPKPPSVAAPIQGVARKKSTRRVTVVRPEPARSASVAYRRNTWTAWRIAAVATLAVGGLSLAVLHRWSGLGTGDSPVIVESAPTGTTPAQATTDSQSSAAAAPSTGTSPAAAAPQVATAAPATAAADGSEGLSVTGDISELSDGDIEILLQGMDAVEAAPLSEPQESVPVMGGVTP